MKKIRFFSILVLMLCMSTFALQAAPKLKAETKMSLMGASTLAMGAGMGLVRNRNIAALEEEATRELSNFDGDEDGYDGDDYDGYDGYTGVNDDFLDFGGGTPNILAAQPGHQYSFQVVNSSDSAKTFYLFGGFKNYETNDALSKGVMTEGQFQAIEDSGSTKSLTATGDTYATVDGFRRFVEKNPTFIQAFQIRSSTAQGITSFNMHVEQQSPFKQLSSFPLRPALYQDQNMFNDKILNIQAGFDANDQIAIKTTIAAGSTINITVICGAILNQAKALENKRKKALRSQSSRRRR